MTTQKEIIYTINKKKYILMDYLITSNSKEVDFEKLAKKYGIIFRGIKEIKKKF